MQILQNQFLRRLNERLNSLVQFPPEKDELFSVSRNLLTETLHQLCGADAQRFPSWLQKFFYLKEKYHFSEQIITNILLLFRITDEKYTSNVDIDCSTVVSKLVLLINELLNIVWDKKLNDHFFDGFVEQSDFNIEPILPTKGGEVPFIKVVLDKIDTNSSIFTAFSEKYDSLLTVRYYLPGRSEAFRWLDYVLRPGSVVGLVNCDIDENGYFLPEFCVLEPDFLVDVTSVAECFSKTGDSVYQYLANKFLMKQNSLAITKGNIANFFLDEILKSENIDELDYRTLFTKTFSLNPLSFALFSDDDVKKLYAECQYHFENIKTVVRRDFPDFQIRKEQTLIEPFFLSPTFGIQGRLDLMHVRADDEGHKDIIELKSGKAPEPTGASQMWINHLIQVQLYDLLLASAYNEERKGFNFILYSGSQTQFLRHASRQKALQQQAIMLRNRMVAIDFELADTAPENLAKKSMGKLKTEFHQNEQGFIFEKFKKIENAIKDARPLERLYFYHFIPFIANELLTARLGSDALENDYGHASLWINSLKRKEKLNEILAFLKLSEERFDLATSDLILLRTEQTQLFSNFRVNDIAVLYPFENENSVAHSSQVFKCSIIYIDKQKIRVRLRGTVANAALEKHKTWALEKDMMDHTISQYNKSIFAFLESPQPFRDLLMGVKAPRFSEVAIRPSEKLTQKQNEIFINALSSKDYFLIQGPPGTGKTTMLLKEIVRRLFFETEENILLLAFTNRAVDEICEAIEETLRSDTAGEGFGAKNSRFIRIGSETSCDEKYKDNLLDKLAGEAKRRIEILEFINKTRVFVANIATINTKTEIFELKNFDTVVIDEASQLIEPHLLYVLGKVGRFIMIGDEKQLPAVVTTDPERTKVEHPELQAIGLTNMRNSLFERLLKLCQKNDWPAFAMLEEQGRMHEDIYWFPKRFFYKDQLVLALPDKQTCSFSETVLWQKLSKSEVEIDRILTQSRFTYIPSVAEANPAPKIHLPEAKLVAKLAHRIVETYGERFTETTLGIITPFRAQINKIRMEMEHLGVDFSRFPIVVDTVERFQGSTRDIILISFAVQTERQLQNLVAMTDDGAVDRKLNVALTRAREAIIMTGMEEVLASNAVYYQLFNELNKRNAVVSFDFQQLETEAVMV